MRGPVRPVRPVLHHLSPLVRGIGSPGDPELIGAATGSLHGQAPLTARRPLGPAGSALLGRSFTGLPERAVHGENGD